jgi:hypothetical protein
MKPRKKNDPEKNKNKKTITLFVSDTRQGIRAITNKKIPPQFLQIIRIAWYLLRAAAALVDSKNPS